MTKAERLKLLKQIEKDIHVCSIDSTFLDDAKSCAIHSAIEELESEPQFLLHSDGKIEQIVKPIDKSAMMYDIYMKGVNMTDEYQGCWVRFKDIEEIVDKYID